MTLPTDPKKREEYIQKQRLAKLGRTPWNKNLTKESDERVKKYALTVSSVRKKEFALGNIALINGAIKGGYITQEKYPDTGKKLGQWVKNNPEHSRKIIKRTIERDPTLPSRAGKTTQFKHPEQTSLTMKKYYSEVKMDSVKYALFIKQSKDAGHFGGTATKLKHPNQASEIGQRTSEKLRNKKNFVWKEVNFDSKAEMEIAKQLVSFPEKNVNVQVKVGSKTIDFFPERLIFIEFHPWDRKYKSSKQYYTERKKAIEKSEYAGTPLKVITHQNEVSNLKKVIQSLKENKCANEKTPKRLFRI